MRYDPTEVAKALELMKEELSDESGDDDDNDSDNGNGNDGDDSSLDYNESLRTIGSTRGGGEFSSHREKNMIKLSSERQFKVDHPHISFGSSRNGSIDSSHVCGEDFARRIEKEERLRERSSKEEEQERINVAVSNIFGRKHDIEEFDYFEDLVELERDADKTRLEALCEIGDSFRSSVSQKSSEWKSTISQKLGRSNTPSEKDDDGSGDSKRSSSTGLPKYAPRDGDGDGDDEIMSSNILQRCRRSTHFHRCSTARTKKTDKKCAAIAFVICIILLVSVVLGWFIPERDSSEESTYETDQEMLLIAESIVENCKISDSSATSSRERCRELCRDHMCCVSPEGDGNGCREDDEGVTCAIYAGCEVLLATDNYNFGDVVQDDTDTMNGGSGGDADKEFDDGASEEAEGDIDPDQVPSTATQYTEEEKLRLAEEVNGECGKSLDESRCRDLCSGRFCCFYEDNDCVDDEDRMCMVYAGCERYYLAFARESRNGDYSQSDESLDSSS